MVCVTMATHVDKVGAELGGDAWRTQADPTPPRGIDATEERIAPGTRRGGIVDTGSGKMKNYTVVIVMLVPEGHIGNGSKDNTGLKGYQMFKGLAVNEGLTCYCGHARPKRMRKTGLNAAARTKHPVVSGAEGALMIDPYATARLPPPR